MPTTPMTTIASYYTTTHDRILAMVENLSQAEIEWSPNPKAPSIAFHLWHTARWADYVAEIIWGAGSQIWEQERLAELWGLNSTLGYADTGLGLEDATPSSLSLPGKDTIIDYARRAFMHGNAAVQSLSEEQFNDVHPDRYGTYWKEHSLGSSILNYLTHTNRHLGMIEALRGLQGLRGTATR